LRKITKGLEGSEDTQHKEDQTESSWGDKYIRRDDWITKNGWKCNTGNLFKKKSYFPLKKFFVDESSKYIHIWSRIFHRGIHGALLSKHAITRWSLRYSSNKLKHKHKFLKTIKVINISFANYWDWAN
jgi:hypothetical protein